MRHTTILLLWVIAGSASGVDLPLSSVGDPGLSIDDAALAEAGLGRYWRLDLPVRLTERVTSLQLLDEHLYAITDRGRLFAIRAESGLVHWQRPIVEPGGVVFPLTHALADEGSGPLVVTTPAWVAFLDRATGTELPLRDSKSGRDLERRPLETPPAASVVANAEYMYASLVDARFVCYRRSNGFSQWVMGSDAPGSTTPRLLPDRVLFASDKGRLLMASAEPSAYGRAIWKDQIGTAPLEPVLGLTSEQRRELWPREAGTRPLEPIFLSPGDLFLTGTDRVVYSIDPITGPVRGECRWRYTLSMRPTEGPAVVGDLLFQQDPGQGLLALERATGRVRWLLPRGQRLLARSGRATHLLSLDGDLLVADEATGRVRGRVPVSGVRFAPTNVRNDAAFLSDAGGRIACIRNLDAKPLERADFLEAASASTTQSAQTQPGAAPASTDGEAPAAPSDAPEAAAEGDVLRSSRF